MIRGALLAALLVAPAAAEPLTWEWGSSGVVLPANARTYTLFAVTPESEGVPQGDAALVVQRVRPQLEAWRGDFGLDAAYDLVPIIGEATLPEAVGALTLAPINPLRLADLDRTLHAGDGWRLDHQLDRASVAWTPLYVGVRLGRQAIGHGSARMFTAADPFSTFGPAAIDTEFKRGVDALRLTVPIGETMEVEAYAVAHEDRPGDALYLARWRASFVGLLDVSLLAGSSYGRPTLAFDLSGDVGGAGWYAEGLSRLDIDDPGDGSAARVTVGVDHRLSPGLRLVAEGHYNQLGALDPDDYLATSSELEYRVGEQFLLGRAYLGATAFYEWTPLVNLSLGWIQNLLDGSLLLTPALAWDFGPETQVNLGALVPVGERLAVAGLAPDVASEFGLYPYVVYTDLRLAF